VHKHILHVLGIGLPIVFRAKPGETLVAQVGFYRIETLDQDIEAQVELFLVDQQRCLDVPLDQQVRVIV
jgi:hypothetical protein